MTSRLVVLLDLPDEVISHIFRLLLSSDHISPSTPIHFNRALLFSSLCRRLLFIYRNLLSQFRIHYPPSNHNVQPVLLSLSPIVRSVVIPSPLDATLPQRQHIILRLPELAAQLTSLHYCELPLWHDETKDLLHKIIPTLRNLSYLTLSCPSKAIFNALMLRPPLRLRSLTLHDLQDDSNCDKLRNLLTNSSISLDTLSITATLFPVSRPTLNRHHRSTVNLIVSLPLGKRAPPDLLRLVTLQVLPRMFPVRSFFVTTLRNAVSSPTYCEHCHDIPITLLTPAAIDAVRNTCLRHPYYTAAVISVSARRPAPRLITQLQPRLPFKAVTLFHTRGITGCYNSPVRNMMPVRYVMASAAVVSVPYEELLTPSGILEPAMDWRFLRSLCVSLSPAEYSHSRTRPTSTMAACRAIRVGEQPTALGCARALSTLAIERCVLRKRWKDVENSAERQIDYEIGVLAGILRQASSLRMLTLSHVGLSRLSRSCMLHAFLSNVRQVCLIHVHRQTCCGSDGGNLYSVNEFRTVVGRQDGELGLEEMLDVLPRFLDGVAHYCPGLKAIIFHMGRVHPEEKGLRKAEMAVKKFAVHRPEVDVSSLLGAIDVKAGRKKVRCMHGIRSYRSAEKRRWSQVV